MNSGNSPLDAPLLEESRILHFIQKGDVEFIEDILDLFKNRSLELVQRLESYQPDQRTEFKKDIHTLKGICYTMGTKRFAEICKLFEQYVDEGKTEEAMKLRMQLGPTRSSSLDALRKTLQG